MSKSPIGIGEYDSAAAAALFDSDEFVVSGVLDSHDDEASKEFDPPALIAATFGTCSLLSYTYQHVAGATADNLLPGGDPWYRIPSGDPTTQFGDSPKQVRNELSGIRCTCCKQSVTVR